MVLHFVDILGYTGFAQNYGYLHRGYIGTTWGDMVT